jgi:hypothetical protein
MRNRRWFKALILFLLLVLGLHFFASNPYWVERYFSRGLYLFGGGLLSAITRSIPFSLFEWLVAALILLFFGQAVRWTLAWLRKRVPFLKATGCLFLRLSVFALALYAWFLLAWGLNYHRVPLHEKLGLGPIYAEESHFITASRWATKEISTLYSDDFPEQVGPATQSVLDALDRVTDKMNEKTPRAPRRFKHFLWNYPLEVTHTYGIISPLTLEPHLSRSLFPVEIPFLAAHEAAHIKGYASETEANLLAFEACLESDHPLARFSGFFSIFAYLCHAIPHDELVRLFNRWPEEVKEIEKRIEERDHQHTGAFLDGIRIAYDIYLKFNATPDGIRSYSRAGGWVAVMHHEEARLALDPSGDREGETTKNPGP